jgi:uncharacterized protein (DUF1501 family)
MSKTKVTRDNHLSRRDLLRFSGGCAALTQTSVLSTLLNLSLLRSAAAAVDTTGYKALVCVFFHGGIDSYNMLVPTDLDGAGAGPLADYQTARSTLALDPAALHGISDIDGRNYGLHPALGDLGSDPDFIQYYPELSNLHSLYHDHGKVAFIANVGSLVEPVLPETYRNGARLPLGLFSHSDQQRHWQTSTPQSRTQITGWLGRMADILSDTVNSNPSISMNIAIDHLNILQTGDGIVPYVVDDRNGAEVLGGYGASNPMDAILSASTDSFLEQSYADLLKNTYAGLQRQSIDAAVQYNDETNIIKTQLNLDPLGSKIVGVLESTYLGRQLLQVALAIGAHGPLGQTRQVFFAERQGWDHHANLINSQNNLMPEVNKAMGAFYDAIKLLGYENDVMTFTASDFARTLNANSNNGSDHAWGGNHIVMGGAVNGGRLYGHYPDSLAPGNAIDLGRGRLIPTLSVDEYSAELAMWFGIENDANLESILPNIRNFYSASDTLSPLGFASNV